MRFVRIYQEILFSDASGGGATMNAGAILASGTNLLNNPDLINQQMSITVKAMASAGGAEKNSFMRRLEGATISYSASVNRDNVTGRDMKGLWNNTIKPYLLQEAQFFLPAGARAVVQESPTYDLSNNAINGTIEMQGVTPTGLPIEGTISVADSYATGVAVVPIWGEHTTSKYTYQGPAQRTRTITKTFKHFEEDLPGGRRNPLPFDGFQAHTPGGFTKKHDVRYEREVIGRQGDSIWLINRIETIEIEYVGGAGGAVGDNLEILFDALGMPVDPPGLNMGPINLNPI